MTQLSKAQSRVRNTRGVSFLTKGGDNYDHKGLNSARRAMDNALINEWLNDGDMSDEPKARVKDLTFRVVISTQVYENYAVHACECETEESCTCGDYWKAKGGDDLQRDIGSAADVLAMGSAGVQAIADEMRKLVEEDTRGYRVHVIGWCLIPSTEETPGEADLREMLEWGYFSNEQYPARLARLTV